MKTTGPGEYSAAPNENITVIVAKQYEPFAATFSDVIGSSWANDSVSADGLTETKTLVMPSDEGATVQFSVLLDFVPDDSGAYDSGDKYTVRIKGNTGSPDSVTVPPPPFISLQFDLVVE